MDVRVPGMVYAAVLQSPYQGGAPENVDYAKARAVPGITDVVKLPGGVGVIRTLPVEAACDREASAQGDLERRASNKL